MSRNSIFHLSDEEYDDYDYYEEYDEFNDYISDFKEKQWNGARKSKMKNLKEFSLLKTLKTIQADAASQIQWLEKDGHQLELPEDVNNQWNGARKSNMKNLEEDLEEVAFLQKTLKKRDAEESIQADPASQIQWLEEDGHQKKLPDAVKNMLEILKYCIERNELTISLMNTSKKIFRMVVRKGNISPYHGFERRDDQCKYVTIEPGVYKEFSFDLTYHPGMCENLHKWVKNPDLQRFPFMEFRIVDSNKTLWLIFINKKGSQRWSARFTTDRPFQGGLKVLSPYVTFPDKSFDSFDVTDIKSDGIRFGFKLRSTQDLSVKLIYLAPDKHGVRLVDLRDSNLNPFFKPCVIAAGTSGDFLWTFGDQRPSDYLEDPKNRNDSNKWPTMELRVSENVFPRSGRMVVSLLWNNFNNEWWINFAVRQAD